MQGKLTLAVGFVAGYVLGSKAGRQRYEEIVAQARKVAGNQTVQSTAGVLQAQASDLVNKAKQSDVVAKAKHTVARGSSDEDTSTYPPPATGTYASETTTSGTDLFEPSTTTDPLSPTKPSNGNNP
jgi:hypothetical protein